MFKKSKMKTTINFRIEKELKDDLQFIALEQDLKISYLIRDILQDYVEDYNRLHFDCESEKSMKEITLYIPRKDSTNI